MNCAKGLLAGRVGYVWVSLCIHSFFYTYESYYKNGNDLKYNHSLGWSYLLALLHS